MAFQIAHFLASYAALDILTSATPEQFFSSLGRLLAFLPLHITIASCSDVILHYSKMFILSVLYCSYSSVSFSPSLPEESHYSVFKCASSQAVDFPVLCFHKAALLWPYPASFISSSCPYFPLYSYIISVPTLNSHSVASPISTAFLERSSTK